jgi:hypothetical protein
VLINERNVYKNECEIFFNALNSILFDSYNKYNSYNILIIFIVKLNYKLINKIENNTRLFRV